MRRVAALMLAIGAAASCGAPQAPVSRGQVASARAAGSWQGRGNRTIGFASESGTFHIRWQTRNERSSQAGIFRLTVRSAISGRPIQVVADYRGEGSGSVDFVDDPRLYDLMVDSADVDWSIDVTEPTGQP